MNKKLPEVNVIRKKVGTLYDYHSIQGSDDVANVLPVCTNKDLLFFLNLNAKGQVIELNCINANDFQPYNFKELVKSSIYSNALTMLLVHSYCTDKMSISENTFELFRNSMETIGIPVLDYIQFDPEYRTIKSTRREWNDSSLTIPQLNIHQEPTYIYDTDNSFIDISVIQESNATIHYNEVPELLAERSFYYDREYFGIVNLDADFNVINYNTVSVGDLSSALIHPRELFKSTLLSDASYIVMTHNHPSGDVTASNEDYQTTKRVMACAKLLGVEILDHIITGDNLYSKMSDTSDLFMYSSICPRPTFKQKMPELGKTDEGRKLSQAEELTKSSQNKDK